MEAAAVAVLVARSSESVTPDYRVGPHQSYSRGIRRIPYKRSMITGVASNLRLLSGVGPQIEAEYGDREDVVRACEVITAPNI